MTTCPWSIVAENPAWPQEYIGNLSRTWLAGSPRGMSLLTIFFSVQRWQIPFNLGFPPRSVRCHFGAHATSPFSSHAKVIPNQPPSLHSHRFCWQVSPPRNKLIRRGSEVNSFPSFPASLLYQLTTLNELFTGKRWIGDWKLNSVTSFVLFQKRSKKTLPDHTGLGNVAAVSTPARSSDHNSARTSWFLVKMFEMLPVDIVQTHKNFEFVQKKTDLKRCSYERWKLCKLADYKK